MYYKSERYPRFGLLALTILLLGSGIAYAQETAPSSDDPLLPSLVSNQSAASAKPASAISLFDDDEDINSLISPQAKPAAAAPASPSVPAPITAQEPASLQPVSNFLDAEEETVVEPVATVEPVANVLPMPSPEPANAQPNAQAQIGRAHV